MGSGWESAVPLPAPSLPWHPPPLLPRALPIPCPGRAAPTSPAPPPIPSPVLVALAHPQAPSSPQKAGTGEHRGHKWVLRSTHVVLSPAASHRWAVCLRRSSGANPRGQILLPGPEGVRPLSSGRGLRTERVLPRVRCAAPFSVASFSAFLGLLPAAWHTCARWLLRPWGTQPDALKEPFFLLTCSLLRERK